MSGLKTDCKKFSPNIFNKTKCQNCFRTKDAHSAEALECNRASRKVSKCGYLFVAPDWDFTVSINRTKRWQRRWFVLYDDGELTYSVDEHPDTVPQAVIDMNHVLEVADAEDITGNQFALAITAPEKVHFIKGTCRDESKWWYDVLSRYPKNTIRGKHKRNATFPGLKAALISENDTKENSKLVYENRIFGNRPRFLSCNTDGYEKNEEPHWEKLNANEDVFPVKEVSSENLTSISNKGRSNSVIDYLHNHFVLTENTNNTLNDKNSFEDKSNIINTSVEKEGSKPVVETVINDVPAKEKIAHTDNVELIKGHSRRYLKRESRGLKSQRSRSDGVAKMIPPLQNREIDGLNYWSGLDFRIKKNNLNSQEKNYHHNPVYLLLSDVPSMKKYESLESLQKDGHSPLVTRRRHTSEKVDGIKPATVELKESQHTNNEEFRSKVVESPVPESNINSENSYKNGVTNWDKEIKQESEQSKPSFNVESECQVRGDPDGCGLDGISICGMSNPEVGTERSFEDTILKKGWLMRYSNSSGWCKHWFVLQNLSLSFYQDPSAEDTGIMDGALDVIEIQSVIETDSDRNYAFTITMWDDKKYLLSAVTAGIRNNWIQALNRVRSIWENSKQKEHIIQSKLDSELNTSDYIKEQTNRIVTSPSPAPSMEEPDKALDVSSSDDHSEYFSIVDEGEFLCRTSSPRPLPPSPPLNRTAISRVKERARSRSSSRSRIGHQFWSSGAEMQHTGIDGDLHSDGGISDNSNSSFHGMSCLSDRKGICCEHPSVIASDIDESHINDEEIASDKVHERKIQNCIKKNKHLEKQDRSKEQKMHMLEKHCRELEIQLKKKEDEVGEKSAELNNLKSLKGSYHDLVEKYNSLKKRLEDCEKKVSGNGNDGKSYRLKYESLRTRYKKEKAEWEGRQGKDRNSEDVSATLERNRKQLYELKTKLEKSPSRKEAYWSEWKETSKLCEEVESLVSKEKYSRKDSDVTKLKKNLSDLETVCRTKQEGLDKHKREAQELLGTPEKDEVNISYNSAKSGGEKLPENIASPNNRNATDGHIISKLDRAKEEMKSLKRQLKEAQNAYDELELHCFKLEQDMKGMEEIHHSQMALMTARVDDLTMKFASSERNLRALRQKLAKAEAKQERRRSSLKGKEALNLSKEYEVKLSELEQKISVLETALQASPETEVSCRSSSEKNSDSMDSIEASSSCQKNLQKRRSSQESGESHGMLLRLHNLDTKVKKTSSLVDKLACNSVNEPVAEKPKILLQVKAGDDADLAGESEDWSSLSVTTSLTDLSTIGGSDIDQEQPQSEKECFGQLNKKVKSLLSWVKAVLEHLYNQNTSPNVPQSSKADTELGNVIGVLEHMCAIDTEKFFSGSKNYEKELLNIVYNLVLIQEVARTLCRLNNFETYKCEVIMEHLSRINYMLILLDERLSCASVENMLKNEQTYSNCNSLLKFTRKLFSPQDTESSLEIENLIKRDQEEILDGLNARLKAVEEKGKVASEFVTQFVNSKKSELTNLLGSVATTSEESMSQSSREVLLANISGAISEVIGRIENQLSIIENEQLSLLRYDWKSFYTLVSAIRKNICQNTTSISSELRQLVLDRPESCCTAVYLKHFVDIVTEIVSVITMHSITAASISFVKESIGQVHIQNTTLSTSESNATDDDVWQSALCERLLNSAKKILGHYHPVDINSIWCDWFCSMTGGNQTTEILARESMMNLVSLKLKFKEEMEKERDAYEHKIHALQLQINSGKNDCDNCRKLQFEICELKTKYEEQLLEKKGNCDHCEKLTVELNSLYRHLEDLNLAIEEEKQILQKNSQEILEKQEREFNAERDKTKKELNVAQKCLHQLKEEYDKQISNLQSTYEQKLLKHDDAISEEAIRQRYHLEIEQLKCLCGSGLNAMEKYHQYTISEMERRHRSEIALLEEEKKKALAEETQATITALQALKKAHREELQSEITKFKESYTQKMQIDKESGNSGKKHESELEEIKFQILSLSDKYSVKCLENASLEERMNSLRSQLQESNFQLFDLLARNKQLRAYLASDIAQKLDNLQNDRQASETEKLKHLLNVKEGELTRQQEEIAHLQQELHLAQTHADALDIHCKQLDHSLKNERALREVEIMSLQSRLEAMLSKSSLECQDDCSSSRAMSNKKHDINVTCGRELARSESYPTLHRLSVPAVLQSASGNTPQGSETW